MYSTLPKSLKMELAVSVKVNKDPEEVERRKKLCQERTPMELGNIGSLSELPIPAPIQNFFSKSEAADKPDKRKRKNMKVQAQTTYSELQGNVAPRFQPLGAGDHGAWSD